jgi:hypothetical protein
MQNKNTLKSFREKKWLQAIKDGKPEWYVRELKKLYNELRNAKQEK